MSQRHVRLHNLAARRNGLHQRSLAVPLLQDLISIPERKRQGDFVLQLSKGVTDARGYCNGTILIIDGGTAARQ